MFLQKKVWNVPQSILSHKMSFLKEKDEKIKSVIGDVPLKSSASTSSAFLSRHWKIFKMIRTCCDSVIGEDDKNHFGYFFTQSSNRSYLPIPILYRVWSCPHGHIHMYAQFNLILLYWDGTVTASALLTELHNYQTIICNAHVMKYYFNASQFFYHVLPHCYLLIRFSLWNCEYTTRMYVNGNK